MKEFTIWVVIGQIFSPSFDDELFASQALVADTQEKAEDLFKRMYAEDGEVEIVAIYGPYIRKDRE